jgi:cellulose synthase/poly-beta-1,6-N-acetylglucosamine synthase-like glycosyltransferase
MKLSILIPCYNEEKTIRACVESCLFQTRKPDQIIVVDDGSTDRSPKILKDFGRQITVVRTPRNTGNKSRAQEYGLQFVTGDVFITADADTILDCNFLRRIAEDFKDPTVAAVAGYVKSLKHNWLTACRELDYVIGQDIHKLAQSEIDAVFVMPGCSSAFKTKIFRRFITFDHDTLTEDMDFTYKLHENDLKIKYDRRAISYTQDPATISAYANQMKRWYSGGWQNLIKHRNIVFDRPGNALELSLVYFEGLTFALMILLLPLINLLFFGYFLLAYITVLGFFALYSTIKRNRPDLLLYFPTYVMLAFINAFLLLATFFKEVVFRKKMRKWFKPERRRITCNQ